MGAGRPDPPSAAGLPVAVREAARRGEPDRYLAALLAPANVQPALVALAAFAAEIRRIPASVGDAMIGEIRLQWWRDAVAAAETGAATGHPVADALGSAMRRHALPTRPLVRLIDARAHELAGELHADDAALEAYFADTEGAPFALALGLVSGAAPPEGLAAKAGLAYGLARTLGELPARLHNGGFPVPQARLEAAGIAPEALAARPLPASARDALALAVDGLRRRARDALAGVRATLAQMPRESLPALLPLAMVEPYFAAQKRLGGRLASDMAEVAPLARVWAIANARMWRRI